MKKINGKKHICFLCKGKGYVVEHIEPRSKKITDSMVKKAIQLYRKGISFRSIAKSISRKGFEPHPNSVRWAIMNYKK